MNLRILKKLSKRAAPIIQQAGVTKGFECFSAERDENYTSSAGHERKHWDRWSAPYPTGFAEVVYKRNNIGTCHVAMREPASPWKGTPMIGAMSGYYEPEWDEETAWDALCSWLHCETTNWSVDPPQAEFYFSNPSKMLAKARSLLARPESKREEAA